MKLRASLLLTAALLLTGCENTDKAESSDTTALPETTASSIITTVSAQTTPPPVITTAPPMSSATTAYALEPAKPSEEYTEVTEKPVSCEVTDKVLYSDIMAQIGYDIPFDITDDSRYEWTIEYVSTLSEEEQREIIAHNYLDCYLEYTHIGNDTCDWLCKASYSVRYTDFPDYSVYTRYFLIKGGAVTGFLLEYEGTSTDTIRCGDMVYLSAVQGGVHELDLATMELKTLCVNTSRLNEVNSRYVAYADMAEERTVVYDRATGERLVTDIYQGWNDGTPTKLTDTELYYYVGDGYYQSGEKSAPVMVIDLRTGMESPTDHDSSFFNKKSIENDRWLVELSDNESGRRNCIITVTDKLDGVLRNYNADEFPEEIFYFPLDRGICDARLVKNTLYILVNGRDYEGYALLILDLEDSSISRLDADTALWEYAEFYSYGIISNISEGGCCFIEIKPCNYEPSIGEHSAFLGLFTEPTEAELALINEKAAEYDEYVLSITCFDEVSLSFLTELEDIHLLELSYTGQPMPFPTPRTADPVDLDAVNSMSIDKLYIHGGDALPLCLDDIALCGAKLIVIDDAHISPCSEGTEKFVGMEDLTAVRVAFEGEAPLKCFSAVNSISLEGCSFYNDDINCISELKSAECLSLCYMDMSELDSLDKLTMLKELSLYTEKEEHMPPLSAVEALKRIEELYYGFAIYSDDEIEQLKALYPDCEFYKTLA